MNELFDLNPDAMAAELAYRRSLLTRVRSYPAAPRARWWRHPTRRTV